MSQEERDEDSALLAPWIVKLESYGEEAAPFLGGRQPDEMVKALTIPTKHLFIRRVAGRARGRQVTAEAGQSREAAARAGSGRGAASSSRLIACCGCVSQLEELMLLEVSELEAGRDSMAEMIGQVNKVVSGWRASLSLSLPSAVSLSLSCLPLSCALLSCALLSLCSLLSPLCPPPSAADGSRPQAMQKHPRRRRTRVRIRQTEAVAVLSAPREPAVVAGSGIVCVLPVLETPHTNQSRAVTYPAPWLCHIQDDAVLS